MRLHLAKVQILKSRREFADKIREKDDIIREKDDEIQRLNADIKERERNYMLHQKLDGYKHKVERISNDVKEVRI